MLWPLSRLPVWVGCVVSMSSCRASPAVDDGSFRGGDQFTEIFPPNLPICLSIRLHRFYGVVFSLQRSLDGGVTNYVADFVVLSFGTK